MGLGAIGGFPTVFSPPSCCRINRGAPILRASALHCRGDIQGASQLGRKIIFFKKMEKIKKKDSWGWYRVFGRVLGAVRAAGPRAGACRAALAAGVPDTGRRFFIYIYKNTFFSPWVCFEKGLGNNED